MVDKSAPSSRVSAARRGTVTQSGKLSRYLALLRGINLGSRNRISMPALREIFESAGAERVSTYIQSGNVLFDATPELAGTVPGLVTDAITAECGFHSPVVIRGAGEMQQAIGGNPFLARGVDPDRLHTLFLESEPAASDAAALDPARSAPDEFAVRGREVYLYIPEGIRNSKLTNVWFDSKLKTVSTGRNWRTCITLARLVNSETGADAS